MSKSIVKKIAAVANPTMIGTNLGLYEASKGAKSKQTIPPSAMDLFNAKVIAALAPYFFRQMAPGVAGQATPETAKTNKETASKGAEQAAQMSLAPGSPQLLSMIDSIGQPGSTKKSADMMFALYGKQPQIAPMGGNIKNTPGIMDMANSAAQIAGLFEKGKNPMTGMQPTDSPTPSYGGGGYYTPYNQIQSPFGGQP